jgi:aspartate carbamoyltransferase
MVHHLERVAHTDPLIFDRVVKDLWEISQRSFFCPETALEGRHVLSMSDFSREELELILAQAENYRKRLANGERLRVMDGKVLATMFYEPSTRTRLSFESAMHRLGGDVISTADGRSSSSAVKGETVTDSVRVLAGYADLIVQRHPAIGSAQEAVHAATPYGIAVINAGDGAGEHPSQAMLDLYTMQHERGHLNGLQVVLAGDLKHGRTVHSLLKALSKWQDIRVTLVSPDSLRMPAELVESLASQMSITETDDLYAATRYADVLYMTRIQKERFTDESDYQAVQGRFVVDQAFMEARPTLTLMHPLPRVDEIDAAVDHHPNAAYFRQAQNGLYVRMALLALVAGRRVL